MTTGIEWTNETWNPVVGCSPVSSGCANCYAVGMTHRLGAMAEADLAAGRDAGRKGNYVGLTVLRPNGTRHFNGVVRCVEEALAVPLGWRNPRKVFVNSMGDLFHEDVPFAFIDRVWAVMALCPQHTFQVLTKRPERMRRYLTAKDAIDCIEQQIRGVELNGMCGRTLTGEYDPAGWPLPNVWLGTSCENQAMADERIPHLLRCPAAVRFLSCEPLLGQVDIQEAYWHMDRDGGDWRSKKDRVDWVIVGGESHRSPGKARACDVAWIRSIVGQCRDAGVACFVKQLGSRPWEDNGWGAPCAENSMKLSDKKGGDPGEWPEDLRVQEFPAGVGV